MSNVIKLTQEELDQLIDVQKRYQTVFYELGQLEANILDQQSVLDSLNREKTSLLSDYQSISTKNKDLADKLFDKYGEGAINIETGEIITP